MAQLEVRTRKLRIAAALVLGGLLMVSLGLFALLSQLTARAANPMVLLSGVILLVTYGVSVWAYLKGQSKSVKLFSDGGVVCNDGRSYSWGDLSRVVHRIRRHRITRLKTVWRVEIHFKNGDSAWLLPTKIINFRDVYAFVCKLPCEQAEV